jgi:hypothetical protein
MPKPHTQRLSKIYNNNGLPGPYARCLIAIGGSAVVAVECWDAEGQTLGFLQGGLTKSVVLVTIGTTAKSLAQFNYDAGVNNVDPDDLGFPANAVGGKYTVQSGVVAWNDAGEWENINVSTNYGIDPKRGAPTANSGPQSIGQQVFMFGNYPL